MTGFIGRARRGKAALVLAIGLGLAAPAFAVLPSEILDDPVLEARAREISRDVRCPVCQGENIDDSNSSTSVILREVIRDRLTQGDSNEEIFAYLYDRYGEFVLFNPRKTGVNLILWLAGPAMLLTGLVIGYVTIRGRKSGEENGLSEDEQAQLDKILKG